MKLLMTTDNLGGVWTYALDLARALTGRDVDVILATLGAPLTPAQREEAAALPRTTVCEGGYRLEWMQEPWDDIRMAGDWLLDLEDAYRPDVVHLNAYPHGDLPWNAPVVMVGHSCVLSWWRAVKGTEAPPAWDRYRGEVRRGLRAADAVVAPTRAMLTSLQLDYGPLRNARVIPNGRDATGFAPWKKEPFILSVGRLWDEAKNIAALEGVAPRLPWPIRVAGDTRAPDGKDRPPRHLQALGKLPSPDLATTFGRASIYVSPARYEPFGLAAVEAAHAGCALVLSDLPSLREVWGEAATFVPPGDTDALHAALLQHIGDPTLRERMAARARARAAALTTGAMADAYLALYQELSNGRGRPRSPKERTPCAS